MYVCNASELSSAQGGQKKALDLLELEFTKKVVSQPYECPGKAASALNCSFIPSPKPLPFGFDLSFESL